MKRGSMGDMRLELFLLKIHDHKDYVNYSFGALEYKIKNNKKLRPFEYGNLIESQKENIERHNALINKIDSYKLSSKFFDNYKTEIFTILKACNTKIEKSTAMLEFFEDYLINRNKKCANLVNFYRVELDDLLKLDT